MISVTSFRVRNLRSIEDSGFIDLKPITLLVGRNSSGKSTLARVMPLLRQSAEATKRGPLLWWGRLVDFGSFDEAANKYADEKVVGLDFRIQFEADDLRASSRRGLGRLSLFRALEPGNIEVSLSFKNLASSTYTSNISVSIYDFRCDVAIDESGFVQSIDCGTHSWRPSRNTLCYAAQDRLIPSHMFFKSPDDGSDNLKTASWESFDPFQSELSRVIRSFVHGNTTELRIRQLATKIPIGRRSEIFKRLVAIANPSSFRESLLQGGQQSSAFTRLCDIAFVSNLDVLLEQISSALNRFSNEVIYLEPLRATAQRYYRQQALAVGEIDSKGENIAMYLDSLDLEQRRDFANWTSRHFGIEVAPRKAGGHISISVKQIEGGAEANIADMGFGFSQVLPIAAQLWAASTAAAPGIPSRQRISNPLIVIEQPELHLHPEYQARLADVFAASIGRMSKVTGRPALGGVRILAETHSPALVNRLGALVAEKVISSEDVQVILMEQESSSQPSTVRHATFDEEGILRNWPIGFFEPSTVN
jgi:predicted ATPase